MRARRSRPWLGFVESERVQSQKKEHSETDVCLPMALRVMDIPFNNNIENLYSVAILCTRRWK